MDIISPGRTSPADTDALEMDVLRCIRSETPIPDALWARIWRLQAAGCPQLGAFWRSRGWTQPPRTLAEWDALPAIPTDAFRHTILHAVREPIARVFRTSGTTQGTRGIHARSRLQAYRTGARVQWQRAYGASGGPRQWLALAPSPHQASDSSLGFMIDDLAREADHSSVTWAIHDTGLDVDTVQRWCANASAVGEPVVVFGTTFAFHHLLELGVGPFGLPSGSLVLDTGGMKRHGDAMDIAMYRERLASTFGVPLTHQGAEYSMTELSSQLYTPWRMDPALATEAADSQRAARYRAPTWCRVTIVNPDSLEPLAVGESGLIRFMDAANVETCAWVQTADLGRLLPGGDIEHLGRVPGAVPRGCSLALEELEALK